jgi:hypothetical protein
MTKYTKLSLLGLSPVITIILMIVIGTVLARSKNSKEVPFASSSKIDTVYVDKRVEVKVKPDTVYWAKPCKKSHCDTESVKPPKIDSIQ